MPEVTTTLVGGEFFLQKLDETAGLERQVASLGIDSLDGQGWWCVILHHQFQFTVAVQVGFCLVLGHAFLGAKCVCKIQKVNKVGVSVSVEVRVAFEMRWDVLWGVIGIGRDIQPVDFGSVFSDTKFEVQVPFG